jgi:hypothetical protein
MLNRDDLKRIVMLTHLTDPMLDRLAKIVDVLKFDEDEYIFRVEQVTACVAAIKPGLSFGWSAMLENADYTVDALCGAPCDVFSFKSAKINVLFEQDPEMGLRFYRRLLVIIKKRLDIRTEQFRQAIKNHPDMQVCFNDWIPGR